MGTRFEGGVQESFKRQASTPDDAARLEKSPDRECRIPLGKSAAGRVVGLLLLRSPSIARWMESRSDGRKAGDCRRAVGRRGGRRERSRELHESRWHIAIGRAGRLGADKGTVLHARRPHDTHKVAIDTRRSYKAAGISKGLGAEGGGRHVYGVGIGGSRGG